MILEVWDQYVRDDGNAELVAAKGNDAKKRRSSTSKPNDLFGKGDRTRGESGVGAQTCSSLRPEARLSISWLQLELRRTAALPSRNINVS